MDKTNTNWMDQSLCASDEEVRQLFLSPYLEEFNEDEFYSDKIGNQKLSKKETTQLKQDFLPEMEEKRAEHQMGYNMYTQVAKNVCGSCPVLQQCEEFAKMKEANGEEVFGVCGGKTKAERNGTVTSLKLLTYVA